VREVALGSGQERGAVGVVGALVVVLEMPPVDAVADGLGDGVVRAVWVDGRVIGEPGSNRGVSDDEFCRPKKMRLSG
jgi:hypothetical protein